MKLLIALFLCWEVLHTTAQYSNCTRILRKLDGDFFDALRKVESNGDLCMISDDGKELGPYQISEEYYMEAVDYDVSLKTKGRRWEFVWGGGSKTYSEQVVKSYICKHGSLIEQASGRVLTRRTLAAVHAGGSDSFRRIENRMFAREVLEVLHSRIKPNGTSEEVCNPRCKPGQCCRKGTCLCFDSDTKKAVECCPNNTATIIVEFSGDLSIFEGTRGFINISYNGAISQTFTVTVESYQCSGTDAAIPGVDYEPVNTRITFTDTVQAHNIEIITIDNDVFEAEGNTKRICLRMTNLTELCPNTVNVGSDKEVLIIEDDPPAFAMSCYTNTTGNSINGWTVILFYSADVVFIPVFQCALNDGDLEPCTNPPPTAYGPLLYGNHTVTVQVTSAITLETRTIAHQVLMVQARLRVVNSSSLQISIQSTKDTIYRCRLNDGMYFSCIDGHVITDLPPMEYNLMVEATSDDDPPQSASDFVGPVSLTNQPTTSSCCGRVELTSTDGLSRYTASWRGRGNRVEFELTGRGRGWVGIGFSKNRIMPESDMIIGATNGSDFFVDDRYATARTMPHRDSIQNVDNAMASFEDGVTTVRFSRLRDTGDENDISLNNCVNFLYAWGGAVSNINTGQIEYHSATRRFVSNSLECMPSTCPVRFDCGNPGAPVNGNFVLNNDTLEDSVARYSCNSGFRIVGNDQRICQSNATWSGTIPTCIS